MTQFYYTVTEKDKELSVKELLRRNFHFSSRLLTKLKKNDLVTVGGFPVRGWMKLQAGDKLTITLPEETCDFLPEDIPIETVFEDEHLLVINKQPGYVVHPTKGKPNNTIANGIMKKMADDGAMYKIRFANRLDMNTSGLLIIAKSSFVQESLIQQMKRNQVEKRYLAVLDGIIMEENGTVDKPIDRPDPDEVERWILPVESGGYDSVTHYTVLRRFKNDSPEGCPSGYTLAELKLETGRTHQIRVHMASIGHPVTGDHLYCNGDPFEYRRTLKEKHLCSESFCSDTANPYIKRQALHAYTLSFTHPVSGEKLELEAPLPDDMKTLIEKIGKLH